jgi:hypothetical protein
MKQIRVETDVVEIEATELQTVAAGSVQDAIVELNSNQWTPARSSWRFKRRSVKVSVNFRAFVATALALAIGTIGFFAWPWTSSAAAYLHCHSAACN